jgi:hypothetical protein
MQRAWPLVLMLAWLALGGAAPESSAPLTDPEQIFAQAKSAWRNRVELPFATYGLLERYTWRDRVHENWWQCAYRGRDRRLALVRIIVPNQEEERLKGTSVLLKLRTHGGEINGDRLETNPNADAFPILDPMIEPNASFGMLRAERQAALVGATPLPRVSAEPAPVPSATATASPQNERNGAPLRELGRVEVFARDYRIELAGVEHVNGVDAYHLKLTPLGDPKTYRLRDLWSAIGTGLTVQLAVDGLFEGKPYEEARWIVSYVTIGGRPYVQQVRTTDTLRFGADRFVSGLEFDFVQYDFPRSLPDYTFEHMLE